MKMEFVSKSLMLTVFFILTIQSCLMIRSHCKSIVTRLPGYPDDLPFKFETGYVGIGEEEEVQLFYYFVESTGNADKDPLILYLPGGPGGSALVSIMYQIGPLRFNLDDALDNLTVTLNPHAWTQMANILFVDIPAGAGFSYAETREGWISGDTIVATQATEFLRKFLIDHPMFLRNPLYIAGISYIGVIVPKVTLDIYEGNERGDQPSLNIQGYILFSPLTNKFMDFNSRFEYAHGMGLISHDIYKSAVEYCQGNYVDIGSQNSVCANSLQSYKECTSSINVENILESFCDVTDPKVDCGSGFTTAIHTWANLKVVQESLNIRQGTIKEWERINTEMHYDQGKNDTYFYSFDIFSSFSFHKMLSKKNCQALIISGDLDMTFPYVGNEQWITSLNLGVEVPWKPFYIDGQVGGYDMKYADNDYSLTFAVVKGAGHGVTPDKPKETIELTKRWFSSQSYTTGSYRR